MMSQVHGRFCFVFIGFFVKSRGEELDNAVFCCLLGLLLTSSFDEGGNFFQALNLRPAQQASPGQQAHH